MLFFRLLHLKVHKKCQILFLGKIIQHTTTSTSIITRSSAISERASCKVG